MQEFFQVINIALVCFMVLIVLRIMSTWFRGTAGDGAVNTISHYLRQITDPYLQLFYRFTFLRAGGMDFTPLAGIFVLVVASEMTRQLANQQQVTLGYFLGVSIFAAWRMASIVVLVFLVACVARFVTLRFLGRTDTPIARMVSALAQAPVRTVSRYIPLRDAGSEANYLLVTIVILFGIWVAGRVVTEFLVRYLFALPSVLGGNPVMG
jgi:YggT family protein